jgi:riboflavin synthase
MFTGLIETTGTILSVEDRAGTKRIAISAPGIAERLRTGDSVAVSGVCLTALDISVEPPLFHADLAAETVARTSLAQLKAGAVVNLELPTPAGTPLGGHVVQGHVDATGTVLSLEPVAAEADVATTDWWLRVSVPENVARYVIEKGSIAIEGISLTVAKFDGKTVTIAIIPHTYAHTNLYTLSPGVPVNLEADVMLRFFEQRQQKKEAEFELTLEYLIANGY